MDSVQNICACGSLLELTLDGNPVVAEDGYRQVMFLSARQRHAASWKYVFAGLPGSSLTLGGDSVAAGCV